MDVLVPNDADYTSSSSMIREGTMDWWNHRSLQEGNEDDSTNACESFEDRIDCTTQEILREPAQEEGGVRLAKQIATVISCPIQVVGDSLQEATLAGLCSCAATITDVDSDGNVASDSTPMNCDCYVCPESLAYYCESPIVGSCQHFNCARDCNGDIDDFRLAILEGGETGSGPEPDPTPPPVDNTPEPASTPTNEDDEKDPGNTPTASTPTLSPPSNGDAGNTGGGGDGGENSQDSSPSIAPATDPFAPADESPNSAAKHWATPSNSILLLWMLFRMVFR